MNTYIICADDFAPSLETQYVIEDLYNKNQTLPRLRQEFRIKEVRDHCREHGIPIDFAIDLMAQMVLHKRATTGTLIGLLHRHFMVDPREVPEIQELQACADMLYRAAEADLVDWDEVSGQFLLRIDVNQEVHDDLDRFQYPLPCVVEPKELESNRDTGYHSPGSSRGSVILRNNHHEDDVCLDHLNRVNRMRISINSNVVAFVQNQWRNLDRKKEDETQQEYLKRVKAFEKYDRTSRDVIAHLMMLGNEFYLTHRYDKRGRCYAQGYHVNPQGNDWNKAVIEFADKEIVSNEKASTVPT